jgi:preprotein translocase subunit SecA
MTGTADTEAFEFQQIYGLEVVVIPTNQAMVRDDMGDLVYLTPEEKYDAILEDVEDCVKRGQPVLVGTASIETSELVSGLLEKAKLPHKVLNAKHHEQEAAIVAEAGVPGAVTIATNMAGRGTDIVLGGNLETQIEALGENPDPAAVEALTEEWKKVHKQVLDAGGLHVIGTERHESRRIDNQLRGRSGRQGDPGSSRFYLSLQDNLMRIFASDKVGGLMQKLGMEKGEAIEHPWVSRAIENAQRKVEGRNFDIRKQLLEYDDVANDQRKVVYEQRNDLMDTSDVSNAITALREDVLDEVFHAHIPRDSIEEQWDVPGLSEALAETFSGEWPIQQWLDDDNDLHEETLKAKILDTLTSGYQEKLALVGEENMRQFEKAMMLQTLDGHWKEHLAAMDYLRQGIHLRGYAQKNPKQEYKREAFSMFSGMLESIKQEVVSLLSKVQVQMPEELALQEQQSQANEFEFKHETFEGLPSESEPEQQATEPEEAHQPFVRDGRKIGRNEPCPCGSGKKYKQCHGRLS